VTLHPSSALAQGFGLNEVGTCAVSRAFAATGTPCPDASTIFWNPAAAAELPGKSISVGASAIIVKGSFRQDSTGRSYPSDINPALPPSLFAAMRFGQGSVGLGVYVPYGLTSQWNDNFPGRFSALRAALQTVYIQPNFAYQVTPNWSVGGGPVFGHSSVDLTQAIDLSQQPAAAGITFNQLGIAYETEFARAQVHGTATALGYNLGVHGKYGPWSVGARYLSALTFNYDHASAKFSQTATGLVLPQGNPVSPTGTPVPLDALLGAQFSPGGALVAQSASSTIKHPWQLQGGVGYTFMEVVEHRRVNHATLTMELGWFATPRLTARLQLVGQKTFNGFDFPDDYPAGQNDEHLFFHDQNLRNDFVNIGAGVDYQLNDRYGLFASYGHTVWGENTHLIDYALTVGISRGF